MDDKREFTGRSREKTGGMSKNRKMVLEAAQKQKEYRVEKVLDETGNAVFKVVEKDTGTPVVPKSKSKKAVQREIAAGVRDAIKNSQSTDEDDNSATQAVEGTGETSVRGYEYAENKAQVSRQRWQAEEYRKAAKEAEIARKKQAEQVAKAKTKEQKVGKYQFDANSDWTRQTKKTTSGHDVQKQLQKQKVQKEAQAAAKRSAKAAETTGKVSAKVAEFIAANWKIILVIGIVVLLLYVSYLATMYFSAMLTQALTVVTSSTSHATPAHLDRADLYMSELEYDLLDEIDHIEDDYPDYDEYRYELDGIGHDPIGIMAFLSAKYMDFRGPDVRADLDHIFEEMYELTLTEIVEIRERPKIDPATGDPIIDPATGEPVMEEYEYYILEVKLETTPVADIVEGMMNAEQKELFDIYLMTNGNLQVFANPLADDWEDKITSYYGYRKNPITEDKELHEGIDIALPSGTQLYATHDGIITDCGYDAERGNYIVITNDQLYSVRYQHLSSIDVTSGQSVLKGQEIGKSGNSGASTGPHLHLEVDYLGEKYNPLFYVHTSD